MRPISRVLWHRGRARGVPNCDMKSTWSGGFRLTCRWNYRAESPTRLMP